MARRCRSPSMQPARYINIPPSLCTWTGLSAQTETPASRSRGVFREPGRIASGTRLKSKIS